MSLSSEDLLAIARLYWPSTRDTYLKQEPSPEFTRLQDLWEQELGRMDRWWSLLGELEEALPGFKLGDATATRDACLRCVAYPPESPRPSGSRWVAVGCLSILAPVYTVYGVQLGYRGTERISQTASLGPLPEETNHVASIIAQRVEALFGATVLPRELAQTRVPLFVEFKEPPETTLLHALFTSTPESIP